MREIGLNLNRSAGRKIAKLDELLAGGRFHENQFGTARRFMAAGFLQTKNVLIEFDGLFEIIDPVARVQQFGGLAHALTIARNWMKATRIRNDDERPPLDLLSASTFAQAWRWDNQVSQ